MQQEITVRENLHDYECQDCFGHELDVHGRCTGCGSEAVALIFRPTTPELDQLFCRPATMISVVIHPAMFWRRAKKALTSEQKPLYEHHRTRLLSRHSCRLTPAPNLEGNASCTFISSMCFL
jgi:hypothetical protein